MKIVARLTRSALCAGGVFAMLTGCGGWQSSTWAAPQSPAVPAGAERSRAWMAPEAKGRDLLYVSLFAVDVYSYPRGVLLGSLGINGNYLCSDKFGNVFIPVESGLNQVFVYAHGASTPKVILYAPSFVSDCSVDPSSESLAVTGSYTGGIMVFPYNRDRGSWSFSKLYIDPKIFLIEFCAYDDKGNLFVDGTGGTSDTFKLAELPKGSKTFTTITLDQNIHAGSSMQWDGKYLAIADRGVGSSTSATIYRFTINGSSGTKVSTTTLNRSYGNAQFWIQGGTVIGPLSYDSVRSIGFWRFSAGGSPIKSLSSNRAPTGETVSLK
jgi:hypothetical protein